MRGVNMRVKHVCLTIMMLILRYFIGYQSLIYIFQKFIFLKCNASKWSNKLIRGFHRRFIINLECCVCINSLFGSD
jgi:hypothetical protein